MMSLQSNVVDVNIIMMVPVHGVDEYHDGDEKEEPTNTAACLVSYHIISTSLVC